MSQPTDKVLLAAARATREIRSLSAERAAWRTYMAAAMAAGQAPAWAAAAADQALEEERGKYGSF